MLISNLQCVGGALAGEVPASLHACHALLLDLAGAPVVPLIGAVRRREAGSDLERLTSCYFQSQLPG